MMSLEQFLHRTLNVFGAIILPSMINMKFDCNALVPVVRDLDEIIKNMDTLIPWLDIRNFLALQGKK